MHDTCSDAILTSETDKLACPMRPVGWNSAEPRIPSGRRCYQAPVDQQRPVHQAACLTAASSGGPAVTVRPYRVLPPHGLYAAIGWHSVRSDRDEGGLQVPRYLLLNGTEPRWRLHDTVDSTDLEESLARVMENGVIIYTLASRNEGETFQSLTINGKNLVTYVITDEDDPDPAKTRSRYEAAGFKQP